MSNEDKKVFLSRYKWEKLAVEQIELELEEFKAKEYPTTIITGMPSAHNKKDLSDYIIRCDKIITKLLKAKNKRIDAYIHITESIERMESEEDKIILNYKYILGFTWEEIAEELGYSYRQVTRLHSKALSNFEPV